VDDCLPYKKVYGEEAPVLAVDGDLVLPNRDQVLS